MANSQNILLDTKIVILTSLVQNLCRFVFIPAKTSTSHMASGSECSTCTMRYRPVTPPLAQVMSSLPPLLTGPA